MDAVAPAVRQAATTQVKVLENFMQRYVKEKDAFRQGNCTPIEGGLMKRDIRVPAPATPIETWIDRENKKEDEANVEELERTSKDYWGRSSQESDGAVPSTPPENDPL